MGLAFFGRWIFSQTWQKWKNGCITRLHVDCTFNGLLYGIALGPFDGKPIGLWNGQCDGVWDEIVTGPFDGRMVGLWNGASDGVLDRIALVKFGGRTAGS